MLVESFVGQACMYYNALECRMIPFCEFVLSSEFEEVLLLSVHPKAALRRLAAQITRGYERPK